MPARGDPDAGQILASRNQHNSEAYKSLSEEEALCLSPKVFFALGGYPDYSALSVSESDPDMEAEVVVPQIPRLDTEEEARLRPIYNQMFDLGKIEKDKKMNLEYGSVEALDRRALQSFNKHKVQVSFCFFNLPFFQTTLIRYVCLSSKGIT